ncbi:Cytoplasmic dynein 1 intermediate chain 1 [Cichlidogyrus casuarinus]|uniref:Cytoplasmic dynein 1 intermediate chain 1 n=1 Tax=Cichlidogyrus casuarinus TaxID=1844966 RepID=A0ABD2QFX5_9PLAT
MGMYEINSFQMSPGVDFPSVTLVQPKLSDIDEQLMKQKKKSESILMYPLSSDVDLLGTDCFKVSFTAEEVSSIEKSEAYLGFLNRAINRVISEMNTPNIIFKDYTGADLEDEFDLLQKPFMTEGPVFYDEFWCKDRCISSLSWSPRHSELIAVSYMENANALHQPPGVVLLWNTRLDKGVPETVLHSQSPVTEIIFAPFQPNLLIGGTYEGIVNVWDTRYGVSKCIDNFARS